MRNKLILRTPAGWHGDMWREALPLGNGALGAQVYGGAWQEIVGISHAELWWRSLTPPMPDVSASLPLQREKLKAGDFRGAERVMADALIEAGYPAGSDRAAYETPDTPVPRIGIPLPLCDVRLRTDEMGAFRHYRRILDMEKGEVTVRFSDGKRNFTRRTFVSRADGLCHMTVEADGPFSLFAELCLHDTESAGDQALPEGAETEHRGGLFFSAEKEKGNFFGALLTAKCDGDCKEEQSGLRVTAASRAEFVLSVFLEGEREAGYAACLAAQKGAKGYEDALADHVILHSASFSAMEFSLGGTRHSLSNEELLLEAYEGESPRELLEKMWSFGRYLLLASSRAGGLPCHLLGIWAGSWQPIWAFNMFNVNLQMTYWQALSGNMPEAHLAVFDYLDRMLPDFRENARKLYGCRGIFISAVSTPESGLHKNRNPHILHFTGAAGWIAQHYYDYYLVTGDETFLRDRALPFLYEVALFYEDFVQRDEEGYLYFAPSNSPENCPKNVKEAGCRSQVTENATMDFAICKELLTNLLEGCAKTGQYREKWEIWQEMLACIPPYRINADGAVCEWMHPAYLDNYEHRHQSHVYPVFPGTEVTRKNDPELYEAFVRAMELRRVVGLKDQSGWSLTYMANVFARLGMGDRAEEVLGYLTRSNVMSNLVTVHNDWRRMGIAVCGDYRQAPVQLDANMGLTAALQEMALFSTRGEIDLFHAIPAVWDRCKIGPVSAKTGTLVWEEMGEGGITATLRQAHGNATFLLSAGAGFAFADGKGDRTVSLAEGEEMTLSLQRNAT